MVWKDPARGGEGYCRGLKRVVLVTLLVFGGGGILNAREEQAGKLRVGEAVQIQAESKILRGVFSAYVLQVDPVKGNVNITNPLNEGKVVLIPLGTKVRMKAPRLGAWIGPLEVLERPGKDSRSLLLGDPSRQGASVLAQTFQRGSRMKVLGVCSGKGGVGKSTFVTNLASYLGSLGKKVCILDGDLGTANVDVLLNLSNKYDLTYVLSGEQTLMEVLVEGRQNVSVLPGGSGIQELTELDELGFQRILEQFCRLEEYLDFLIIDTSSGLSKIVTNFILAARHGVLVCTPEPHAITDAYALLKVLAKFQVGLRLDIVVNRAEREEEAFAAFEKLRFAAQKFLDLETGYGGYISEDSLVRTCVKKQRLFVEEHPRSRPSRCVAEIAQRVCLDSSSSGGSGEVLKDGFLQRIRSLFLSR